MYADPLHSQYMHRMNHARGPSSHLSRTHVHIHCHVFLYACVVCACVSVYVHALGSQKKTQTQSFSELFDDDYCWIGCSLFSFFVYFHCTGIVCLCMCMYEQWACVVWWIRSVRFCSITPSRSRTITQFVSVSHSALCMDSSDCVHSHWRWLLAW